MSTQKTLPTFEKAWQIVTEISAQIKHAQEQVERVVTSLN
jgi:hypothetical protein